MALKGRAFLPIEANPNTFPLALTNADAKATILVGQRPAAWVGRRFGARLGELRRFQERLCAAPTCQGCRGAAGASTCNFVSQPNREHGGVCLSGSGGACSRLSGV